MSNEAKTSKSVDPNYWFNLAVENFIVQGKSKRTAETYARELRLLTKYYKGIGLDYERRNDLDIINNKKCVKPTENNPFMNPNILTTKKGNEDYEACSIINKNVNKNINKFFYQKIFRNADDIYDKSTLDRQFYTVPSTTIPNDREKLGEWLYDRGPSCKEGNGMKCYNNLYNNIKNGVQI